MNYWSCSAFANWIRGTMKPTSETSSGWRKWRKEAKAKHPVRYWIAEEGLDLVQNFVNWPRDQLYSLKYWINNRFVTRTHTLTSFSLKKGQWHEFETRLLHCAFDELVNFVEIEQAWLNIAWDKKAREKFKSPFWSWGWCRWRTWRCPEAGLDYLNWASALTNEEWLEDDKKHEAQLTHHALAARETLALYNWWKNVRPFRPDPMDASGWRKLCEQHREDGKDFLDFEERTPEDAEKTRKVLDQCHALEEQYEQEDEEMLIRLIKLRRSLWT